jgi:amidohydrolase
MSATYNPGKVTVDVSGASATSTAPLENSVVSVRPEVAALEAEMVENRRWLHVHPELSFKEVETAKFVAEKLRSYGITELWEGVGRTGVVALIRGEAGSGPCIGLRADMDALPLQETGDCPFISQNTGVMHACGHDGHVSMLLAAAKVLFGSRKTLRGCVKLVFQPAEEG